MFKTKFHKLMKRFLTGMLCAGILTSQPAVTYAAETSATPEAGHSETYSQASDIDSVKGWPTGPNIEGQSAVLMDAVTDTILYSKNAKDKLYPASITKIMTALLACEYLDMNDTITMSQEAAYGIEAGSSSIYAETGEVFTVEQALMALMLESANEMALALAEKTSGSVKKFVELMNQRAAQLGCKNTHFNNPNGLPDENHWTSAHDMALIASAAYKNETFRKIVGTGTYEIPPTNKHAEPTPLSNDHQMLYPSRTRKYLYDYCTGGKTGFTDDAGNTLVTYAEKDGMTLVCVILHSTNPQHYLDTTSLLDYCFNNFQVVNIAQNEKTISDESLKDKGILNNNQSFVSLDDASYVVIPKTAAFTDTSSTMEIKQSGGDSVAEIKYSYAGHDVGSAKIIASQVEAPESVFDERETASEEDGNAKKVVVIKPIYIIGAIAAVAVLAMIIFLVKKVYDNMYVIRHNRDVRKKQKDRFKEPKQDKYNKKNRLFK